MTAEKNSMAYTRALALVIQRTVPQPRSSITRSNLQRATPSLNVKPSNFSPHAAIVA
jgi:hypothetical protein